MFSDASGRGLGTEVNDALAAIEDSGARRAAQGAAAAGQYGLTCDETAGGETGGPPGGAVLGLVECALLFWVAAWLAKHTGSAWLAEQAERTRFLSLFV